MSAHNFNIALVGNPNTGKSTIFNILTGLNQKTGNFPGVTVEKRTGQYIGLDGRVCIVTDLPGTYSIYPKSLDESIVINTIGSVEQGVRPDLIVFVADANNLKRNLLLFSQVSDFGIPIVLVINMMDELESKGAVINTDLLASQLGVQVVAISAKKDKRLLSLKKALTYCNNIATQATFYTLNENEEAAVNSISSNLSFSNITPYQQLQYIHQVDWCDFLDNEQKENIRTIVQAQKFVPSENQAQENIARYQKIHQILAATFIPSSTINSNFSKNWFDKIATHPIWGFALFFLVLFIIFQAIFSWSEYPTMWIENLFSIIAELCQNHLPKGIIADIITKGVLAGLSGVIVFIPQIVFLFAFISILEDSGYMSRVIFITDKIMRKVGLNGRSIVPLVGGFACAVPSIMSTRGIGNYKERLITILVTPLISCSARLPIFILFISIAFPQKSDSFFLNIQGIALMSLYVVSLIAAIVVAYISKFLIKSREASFLVMELPIYRFPIARNVWQSVYSKAKAFVLEAGKVIIIISLILWALCSFAPSGKFEAIDQKYSSSKNIETEKLIAAEKLEVSYAGMLGKIIEPSIKPLGFDWKIGISLITSFAAREVFVGTMSTIYSANGDENDVTSVREKLQTARDADGNLIFNMATSCSLMVFYLFAMQCMSTLAVVYKETQSLKWPIIQFLYMGGLAYILSFICYQILR